MLAVIINSNICHLFFQFWVYRQALWCTIIITLLTTLQWPYFVDLVGYKTEKKKMHCLVAQHSCLHCGVSCYSFVQLSQVEEIDNRKSKDHTTLFQCSSNVWKWNPYIAVQLHLKSINFTSLRRKNFLGKGLGAGDNTTIIWRSKSTSLLKGIRNILILYLSWKPLTDSCTMHLASG